MVGGEILYFFAVNTCEYKVPTFRLPRIQGLQSRNAQVGAARKGLKYIRGYL